MNADLLPLLDRLGRPRVLVVGDLILDRYTWGDAERVSQEAPVILLRADKREARLGGAANVCHMLRGLEADVRCAGVVGADPDGATVRHLLHDAGVDAACVLRDRGRPTTVKERFIGRAAGRHPHQILRVDTEVREPLSEELEHRLVSQLIDGLHQFDVVLVSDYDKGVCTPNLLAELIAACRARRIPVVVDPIRGGDYARYRGATTMTPNRLEAELASGVKIKRPADAFAAGRKLCEKLDLEYAIVTLDCDGMALCKAGGQRLEAGGRAEGTAFRVQGSESDIQFHPSDLQPPASSLQPAQHFPTRPRAVYDITGAGDMVLATIGLGIAAGLAIEDTIRLANVAGGLEVEQVGVVPISREEIRLDILRHGREGSAAKIVALDDAARIVRACREKGQRIVFTNGCFDLLHQGHVAYLEEAAAQGDLLVLGLNSDSSVRGLKGPGRPVRKQADRAAVLAALAHVDYVVVFDEPTPIGLIEALRPDVLVKGGDYRHKLHEITGRELVESYGGRLHLAGFVEGASTTNIIRTIAA